MQINPIFQEQDIYGTYDGVLLGGPASPWELAMPNRPDKLIIPYQLDRIFYDATTIRQSISNAERYYYPTRTKLMQIYETINQNALVTSLLTDYILSVLNKDIILGTSQNDASLSSTSIICENEWFQALCSDILMARFFGFSAQYLGDWDGVKMCHDTTIRREFIDPDRRIKLPLPSMPNGASFEDPQMALHYALITTRHDEGRMSCGYGLFHKIMIEFLYYKETRGGQAQFLQKFGVPNVHIKTDAADNQYITDPSGDGNKKIINPTWKVINDSAKDYTSSGILVTNNEVEVALLQANSGRNDPFTAFSDTQSKTIKAIILGHENAQTTTPGKLGSSQGGTDSPENMNKSGVILHACKFLCHVLNSVILDKLVFKGVPIKAGMRFYIPDITTKNEEHLMKISKNTQFFAMVGQAATAGYELPIDYVSKETGMPFVKKAIVEESKPAVSKPKPN